MTHLPGFPRLAGSLLLVLNCACASRPDEQIDLAQKALEGAKTEHAAEFASAEWKSAEDAMEQAEALLKEERYSQAGTMFLRAKSRYEKARDIAKSKRHVVLSEVKGLQGTIELRYKSLKNSLDANAGRLSGARKQSLEESFVEIDKGMEKIKADIELGEYTEAKNGAQTTMRRVYEAEKELEGYLGLRRRP